MVDNNRLQSIYTGEHLGALFSAKSYSELPKTNGSVFWVRNEELGGGYWDYKLTKKNVVTKEPKIEKLGKANIGEHWETAPDHDLPDMEEGYEFVLLKTHDNGYRTWKFRKCEPRTFEEMAKHQEANKEQTQLKFAKPEKYEQLIPYKETDIGITITRTQGEPLPFTEGNIHWSVIDVQNQNIMYKLVSNEKEITRGGSPKENYLKDAHLIPGLTKRYEEMKSEDPQWDEKYLRWIPAAGEIVETPIVSNEQRNREVIDRNFRILEDRTDALELKIDELTLLARNTRFVMWFLVSALVVEGVAKLIGVWN